MTEPANSSDQPPLVRTVTANIEAQVVGQTDLILAVACAGTYDNVDETLNVRLGGEKLSPQVMVGDAGSRSHMLRGVTDGQLQIEYRAEITGMVNQEEGTDEAWFRYLRPSRYCESDRLGPLAYGDFGHLEGHDLLAGVSDWVNANLAYVTGWSRPTDGAVATLLGRAGVCRDFAHLTAALLRANNVPARVVSVYAPGLMPMDFHAVAEACLDGKWFVVDPTRLAPRQSLVRIASGLDATETAFLTNIGGTVNLNNLWVTALVQPQLSVDNFSAPGWIQ